MKKLIVACAAGLAGLLSAGSARAQFYTPPQVNPFYRPPVSPYLNLMRPGTPGGINYYGLVRPQLQFSTGLQRVEQEALAARYQDGAYPTTGHATRFFNYGGYFMNQGGGPTTTGRGVGGNVNRGAPIAGQAIMPPVGAFGVITGPRTTTTGR
jgi:hypothetical protein